MNTGKGIIISAGNKLCLNLCNLVSFLIVTFTGSVIQIQYHMHGLPEAYSAMGFDKTGWAQLHKASAITFFAGLAVHCSLNRGFFATSTRRIFHGKPYPFLSHSYLLFLVSVATCLTAMMSWILFGSEELARIALVETHDRLGWLLIIFGLIHLIARSGRMIGPVRKARGKAMIGRNRTKYLRFDSGKCRACWKCLDVCPKDAFGKINILIHKHIKIVRRDHCIGCLKCVKTCSHGAINPIAVKKV